MPVVALYRVHSLYKWSTLFIKKYKKYANMDAPPHLTRILPLVSIVLRLIAD